MLFRRLTYVVEIETTLPNVSASRSVTQKMSGLRRHSKIADNLSPLLAISHSYPPSISSAYLLMPTTPTFLVSLEAPFRQAPLASSHIPSPSLSHSAPIYVHRTRRRVGGNRSLSRKKWQEIPR